MKKTFVMIALLALIGCSYQEDAPTEPVFNSSYDGSVRQVEDWLDKNFNDPKSIERIEWSPVMKSEQGNYVVRYKFRARNTQGGMELYNKVFILNSAGTVLAVSDYDKSAGS